MGGAVHRAQRGHGVVARSGGGAGAGDRLSRPPDPCAPDPRSTNPRDVRSVGRCHHRLGPGKILVHALPGATAMPDRPSLLEVHRGVAHQDQADHAGRVMRQAHVAVGALGLERDLELFADAALERLAAFGDHAVDGHRVVAPVGRHEPYRVAGPDADDGGLEHVAHPLVVAVEHPHLDRLGERGAGDEGGREAREGGRENGVAHDCPPSGPPAKSREPSRPCRTEPARARPRARHRQRRRAGMPSARSVRPERRNSSPVRRLERIAPSRVRRHKCGIMTSRPPAPAPLRHVPPRHTGTP